MEKETVHRRHRLITGVPPTVMAPGLHKGVTEASELQRSKSVGGFPPKGEPVAPIEKLLQEFEGEDLDKESKGEAEDISCQIILEDDKDGQEQGDLKRVDQDKDKDKDKEKVEKEVEKKEEEEQIKTDQDEDKRVKEKENSVLELNSTQTLEKELQALKLDDLLLDTETNLAKPPVAFVEIDLEERTEEKIENTLTEEKSSKAEAGDMSEDESKTMWICCFPISTKKKSKEKA
ncbi:uncharacterized protein C13orf46 homolog isoform X2 [Sminthopsis crassicaudata]|uniref:uncharacterized protein C13orf46 homolog isoform X2 n=1 Tax=Sminthopsis crassicaudata TaxID=9301 RepID=UPI003D687AEA